MPQVLAAVVVPIASAIGGAVTAIASVIPGVTGLGALSAGHAVGTFVASLGFTNGLASGFTALALTASIASTISGPPHPKVGSSNGGSQIDWKADPSAPLPYLIGRTGTPGSIIKVATAGEKNELLCYLSVHSACGPIEEIGQFTADRIALTFSREEPTGDLAVSGVGPDGEPNGRFTDRVLMWDRRQLGAIPSPAFQPPAAEGLIVDWTDDHKLSGLAATWWVLNLDQQAYPTGAPQPMYVDKGVRCYDPRLDSTYPGGSGSHRVDDRTTWTFTENPGLHGLTWVLGHYSPDGKKMMGIGAPAAGIDIPAFVECANVCDANGWKVGGVVYSSDDKFDVLRTILQAGSARPMKLAAMISCFTDTPRVSLATLTGADVVGEAIIPAGRLRRERINAVPPRYRSEEHDWELIDADHVVVADYVTADGRQRTKPVAYALVQDAGQCGQLAAYDIVNSREFGPITLPLKPYWYGFKPGDAVTINEPEYGLNNQLTVITDRDPDPSSAVTTLQFRSETTAKHDFALGKTAVPPPTPGLTGVDPSVVPVPGVTGWAIVAGEIVNDSGKFPALVIEGAVDDPSATGVIVDYKEEALEDWATEEYPASVTRIEIRAVKPETLYRARIRYRSALGVEDTSAARDLGTITTGKMVATDSHSLGGTVAGTVFGAIAAAEAAIVSLNTRLAEANALLAEYQTLANEATEGLAEAVILRALDTRDTKLDTDAKLYIDGAPIGAVVVEQAVKTDFSYEFLSVATVKNESGQAVAFDGTYINVSPTETLTHRLTLLQSNLDDGFAEVALNYATNTSLTSAIASATTALTSSFNDAIATATQDFVTEADVDSAISAARTQITSEYGAAISSATSSLVTASYVNSAVAAATTSITSAYQSYVASAVSNFVTMSTVNSAFASYDTTIKAFFNNPAAPGNTLGASASLTAQALATLSGQLIGSIGLTARAGNVVAGMQLITASGATNLGAVVFDVDEFMVKSGSNPAVTPMYWSGGSLFTDTMVMRTGNIATGNIVTAHVGNGQITKLSPVLNVNTSLVLNGSDQSVPGSVSVDFPTFGTGVELNLYAEVANAADVTGTAIITIWRDVWTFVDATAVGMKTGHNVIAPIGLPTADVPPAGAHSYSLTARQTGTPGLTLPRAQLRATLLQR